MHVAQRDLPRKAFFELCLDLVMVLVDVDQVRNNQRCRHQQRHNDQNRDSEFAHTCPAFCNEITHSSFRLAQGVPLRFEPILRGMVARRGGVDEQGKPLLNLRFHSHLSHRKGFQVPGYTRRQLKEDKFAETAQDAAQWASGHRSLLVWSISLIVVVVLATVGIITWRNRQIEQGNEDLAAAMRILNAPLRQPGTPPPAAGDTPSFTSATERAKAAEKQLAQIADKYSLVPPGKIGRYLHGVALLQIGDKTAAEQEIKKGADSRSAE